MPQDPQDLMMTLLAGMGMTKLPSILKGLRGSAPAPLPETDTAAGLQLVNPELMPFLLQMLGGGQEPSGSAPMPTPAPAVLRWLADAAGAVLAAVHGGANLLHHPSLRDLEACYHRLHPPTHERGHHGE